MKRVNYSMAKVIKNILVVLNFLFMNNFISYTTPKGEFIPNVSKFSILFYSSIVSIVYSYFADFNFFVFLTIFILPGLWKFCNHVTQFYGLRYKRYNNDKFTEYFQNKFHLALKNEPLFFKTATIVTVNYFVEHISELINKHLIIIFDKENYIEINNTNKKYGSYLKLLITTDLLPHYGDFTEYEGIYVTENSYFGKDKVAKYFPKAFQVDIRHVFKEKFMYRFKNDKWLVDLILTFFSSIFIFVDEHSTKLRSLNILSNFNKPYIYSEKDKTLPGDLIEVGENIKVKKMSKEEEEEFFKARKLFIKNYVLKNKCGSKKPEIIFEIQSAFQKKNPEIEVLLSEYKVMDKYPEELKELYNLASHINLLKML